MSFVPRLRSHEERALHLRAASLQQEATLCFHHRAPLAERCTVQWLGQHLHSNSEQGCASQASCTN